MKTFSIHQAKTRLSRLLAEAAAGEDVVIAKRGKPIARLVLIEPVEPKRAPRIPGSMKGKIWIADDFDDPLPSDMNIPTAR